MLKDEDRIFKNLYNDKGADLKSSQSKRGLDLIQKNYVQKEEIG